MKNTVKEIATCKVEATVEVDKDFWVDTQNKAFKKLSSSIVIKGFRPGKAPEKMLRERVEEGRILQGAVEMILQPAYAQLLQAEKINPFERPDVEVTKLSKDEVTLKFTIVTAPKVTLGAYKDLHAEKEAPSVSDEEVSHEIEHRLERAAMLEKVDREARLGDTVTLDFEGFIDGVPFDGGKADNYELELGSKSFVPGFEEALVGAKEGEEKEVKIVFPEQYVAELAGKPATFQCKIKAVKEKKIPSLDDEAVKDMGIKDVETVDKLREYEKEEILKRKLNDAERAYYEAIVNQIVEGSKVEMADEVIAHEASHSVENLKKQVEQNGLSFEQYLQIVGKKEEDLLAEAKVDAEKNIRRYLCLMELGAKEKLLVTSAELDVEIAKMADQYKMTVEDVRKALGNNLEGFRENLQNKKIQDFILANNH